MHFGVFKKFIFFLFFLLKVALKITGKHIAMPHNNFLILYLQSS